ncbi:hypothetical protein J2J97_32180 (plasmid) [Rhizobium bangladeshense]|uniref:hypothetical protein n=1 Tax=Rhizobium bangladeshense TaxID=1138189 RepID=UPI001A9878D1|nr:hypothetical protein [Rhizobium bangladeshense]QSY98564.1 hypothetical protein J2J97_32180 [Rhizobium bangladeshense]
MSAQIAQALGVAEQFVTNVETIGKDVHFDLNGVPYYARLVRGKFHPDNMRRNAR